MRTLYALAAAFGIGVLWLGTQPAPDATAFSAISAIATLTRSGIADALASTDWIWLLFFTAVPALLVFLAATPTTTCRSRAGDRHLKFYETRDNLHAIIPRASGVAVVVTSALRYWAPIDIPSAFADPCPDSEAGVRSQAVTSTEPHRLREPRACPVVKRHNAKSHHCWSQREVTIARTLRRAPVTEVCHSQVRNFAETPDRPVGLQYRSERFHYVD